MLRLRRRPSTVTVRFMPGPERAAAPTPTRLCGRPHPPVDLGNGPEQSGTCVEPYGHVDALHRTADGRLWCTGTEDLAAVLAFLHRVRSAEPGWGPGRDYIDHLAKLAREEAMDS